MARVVNIPQENSIYDHIRVAINYQQYDQAIQIYNSLTIQEQLFLSEQFPEIFVLLNQINMRQKMATATGTTNT